MFVIVTYDIQEDRRRHRIHKALKSFGQWVQYSVFECELQKADYLRMRQRLETLIDNSTDSVRFYFLCDSCLPKVERIGGILPLDENAIFID